MGNGATNSALAICKVLHDRAHDVLARKGPRFDLIDGRPLPNIPCLPPVRSLAPDSEENLERMYGTQWKHTVPDVPYRYLNPKP